jgi:hypothetical protein
VVGITTAAIASACGGSGTSLDNYPADGSTRTPGVCQALDEEETYAGTVRVGLTEVMLKEGEEQKIFNDNYRLRVLEIGDDVVLTIVDADGEQLPWIQDQEGERAANLIYLEPGESWTIRMPDGSTTTITLCATGHYEDGDAFALIDCPDFDWCTDVNRHYSETSTYETNFYGTQTISTRYHQAGETADRDDATCNVRDPEIRGERSTFEDSIMPGQQEIGSRIKVIGDEVEAVTLDESGYLTIAEEEAKNANVEVNETVSTIIGEGGTETGITVRVTDWKNRGGEYFASLSITAVVNGRTVGFENIDERATGIYEVTVDGEAKLVRFRARNDGKVVVQILGGITNLVDGDTIVIDGDVYRVNLLEESGGMSNGIGGYELTME